MYLVDFELELLYSIGSGNDATTKGDTMKELKKGWFAKAKKKVIKKRVYSFKLYDGGRNVTYNDWHIHRCPKRYTNDLTYRYLSEEDRQLVDHIRGLSFAKSFNYARKLKLQNPKDYSFWWEKVKKF
jgi:hypothetical protein